MADAAATPVVCADPTDEEYLLYLVWICLCRTPKSLKNPIHDILISSWNNLEELSLDSLLIFAPNLLEICQSKTPPSVACLKEVPNSLTDSEDGWGVYLLVLEKPGNRPKIYVGSGTSSHGGVLQRLQNYDEKQVLPRFVKQAFSDGYQIVHRAMLCWAPLPAIGKKFQLRALFLIIEATFSFVLWAMVSRKDYGMPTFCPWSLHDLEYDGLCSHSSLWEGIRHGYEGLTVAQIAAKELAQLHAVMSDSERESRAKSLAKYNERCRAAKYFECKTCNRVFIRQVNLNTHNKTKVHLDKTAGLYIVPDAVALRTHVCEVCDRAFRDLTHLNTHKVLMKHMDKPMRTSKEAENKLKYGGKFDCKTCNTTYPHAHSLETHLTTQKHLNNAAGVQKVTDHHREAQTIANVASRKFHCIVCNYSFGQAADLARRKKTRKHETALLESTVSIRVKSDHTCVICGFSSPGLHKYDLHIKTRKHLDKVSDLALRNESEPHKAKVTAVEQLALSSNILPVERSNKVMVTTSPVHSIISASIKESTQSIIAPPVKRPQSSIAATSFKISKRSAISTSPRRSPQALVKDSRRKTLTAVS